MASICFYFHVHQPRRVKRFRAFDIGTGINYFDDDSLTDLNNARIIEKVARKCYLPANQLFCELLQQYPEFKISYSITGVFLDQLTEFPEVLDSFRRLVDTGRVEIVGETYYHSLAFLHSPKEFEHQVKMHSDKINELFGVRPEVFRNTELIYNNWIAEVVAARGFKGILTEGADRVLGWRSPNYLYRSTAPSALPLLLKNYRLSDDIAFRFSSKEWPEYPLTAPKFANWVSQVNGNGNVVNLFMDYETLGEHQWEDTGIFDFIRSLPAEIYNHPDNNFVTPTEAISLYQPVAELDIPDYISWADMERDLSAWVENDMQQEALRKIYQLEEQVLATHDPEMIETWRLLQTSDHFYYMCTKWFADGDVHKYFSPYDSPYIAFLSYMNALQDFTLRIEAHHKKAQQPKPQTTKQSLIPMPFRRALQI